MMKQWSGIVTKDIVIDNRRPDDDSYPNFEPPELSEVPLMEDLSEYYNNGLLIVKEGDYLVDYDGDIMIATTTNDPERWANDFLKSINVPYFRAKYLGNDDDSLEYANQCRRATTEEIEIAKRYVRTDLKVTTGGQVVLL